MTRIRKTLAGLALVASLSACGAATENTSADSTPQPVTASAPAQTSAAKAASPDFVKYVKDNFPGVSWADSITGSEVKFGTRLWVHTKYGDNATAKAQAHKICRAASAYQIQTTGQFTGVDVRAKDGSRLVRRDSASDPC